MLERTKDSAIILFSDLVLKSLAYTVDAMLPLYTATAPKTKIHSSSKKNAAIDENESDTRTIPEGVGRGLRQRKIQVTSNIPIRMASSSSKSPSSKRRMNINSTNKFNKLVDWIVDTFKVLSLFLLLIAGFYITLKTDFTPRRSGTRLRAVAAPARNSTPATSIKEQKEKQQNEMQVYHVTCKNGHVGILNDDYCDCWEDGSDEPLTSACSNILVKNPTYTCTSNNKDLSTITIYPSRIRDGIIDCSDGSDEK